MHVLIAFAIGLAAALLPSAGLTVLRSWLRQNRALRQMQVETHTTTGSEARP